MSNVNQADTGRTYGVGRYLLLILCGGALLTVASFRSAGAESDTAKAGQMQAQLAADSHLRQSKHAHIHQKR